MSAGPPDLPDDFPEFRDAPPWIMEEMIAAEPALAEDIAGREGPAEAVASLVRATLERRDRIAVVGCGTSEHGALAVAEQLNHAITDGGGGPAGAAQARQALEAAQDPWGGLCMGVSHEGQTHATVAAMAAARARGADVALITASADTPATEAADHVLTTPLTDRSWCHTVGYMSPIVSGGAIAGAVRGSRVRGADIRRHLEETSGRADQAERVAAALHGVRHLVIAGSGADRIAAREMALKVEEGVRLPAVGRDLETMMHGHLVACDESTGLVLFVTDPRGRRRAARAEQLLRAAGRIGLRTAAVVTDEIDRAWGADLTGAGRVVVPESAALDPVLSSLGATAIALQLLTLALIHREGTNPDLIRREEQPYREAADIAESSFPPEE